MDLIASSPRLSTLVERQTSANHHPHHYSVAPSTTIATKHTAYANNNNSINNINNSNNSNNNNNNNNNNTNFSHRPVSHNPTPSDWKGSTINKNAQHGQV
jgi:hypothetical protein